MTKTFISIIILLFFISCKWGCAQTSDKLVNDRIREFENNIVSWVKIENAPTWTLEERMKFYNAKGVSIAVINNYKIEWAKGYGWADSAEKRPVTVHTLFQAASNSKSINSLAVLKLVQEGKIDLNEDINTYLKSWKFPYDSLSKGKKITVANLLSHTAGLTVGGFEGYEQGDTIPNIIQILNGQSPANSKPVRSMFEPGFKFEYSSGGTTISQLILTDITHEAYDKYMYKTILQPLGMTESFFTQPPSKEKLKQLATGYYADGEEIEKKYHTYPEQAAAGLWTTPSDFAKYVIETQLSLQGKSNKIISEKTQKLRLTPYVDSLAALGTIIMNRSGSKYFHHGGRCFGFTAQHFGSLEHGYGVVVMINEDNSIQAEQLLNEIINSVAYTYKWPNFFTPVIKKEITPEKDTWSEYIGNYKIGNDTAVVLNKKDGLWLIISGSTCKIHFTDKSNFFLYESVRTEFKFLFDDKHVVGLLINGDYWAQKLD